MPAVTTLAQRTDAIAITRGQVSLLARTPPCRPPARARARAKKKEEGDAVAVVRIFGLRPQSSSQPTATTAAVEAAARDGRRSLPSFALPRGSLLSPSKSALVSHK